MNHFTWIRALLRTGFSAAALLLAVAPAAAQEQTGGNALELQHRSQIRMRYAQSAWPRGVARQGLANQLALPGWSADPLQSADGRLTRSFRRSGEQLAAPAFVIESWVADGAAQAQEALVDWLAGLQSTQRMPSVDELGLGLGDAGFAGPSGASPRAFAWIAFVRGNVAVRVSASSARAAAEIDLAEIARSVDRAVLRSPELEAGAHPARPALREFRAARSAAVAGAIVPLFIDLADPAQGEPHLQWVLSGPGQGYVERAADGSWALHTTGPGRLTLSLEVTASTGSFLRSQTLTFELADD